METLAVALIAGVLGPSILATLTWFFKRSDQREKWRREDIIASKVDEVKIDLQKQDEKITNKLKANELQLNRIHLLVNSSLTIAKKAEYDALVRELISLRELISFKEETGKKPDPQTLAYIDEAVEKIAELKQELEDREEVQKQVDDI